MKKTWLYSCLSATAVCALATTAHADPIPGIVYVPTEEVELIASGTGGDPICTGVGAFHAGLGCYPGGGTVAAFAGAETLVDDMRVALADFAVTLTHDRPPKYVPYMMLLPSDDEDAESRSFTCTATGTPDCAASRTRRRIGRTIGGSQQCTDPDLLQAALYAFGRMSGLEGIANELDPMGYDSSDSTVQPIDWTQLAHEFQDSCSARVAQFGFNDRDQIITQQFECTNADHVECETDEQNSYADLMAAYGEPIEDTDAPVIAIVFPEDGAEIAHDAEIVIEASVEEASDHVGARFVLEGEGLIELIEVDSWEFCTNQACRPTEGALAAAPEANWHWADGHRWKETASPFTMPSISGLPAGTYTATFEAADPHGNVAEPVMVTFTVLEAPEGEDETGGGDATAGDGTGGNGDGGDSFTGPDDGGGTGDGPPPTGEDDDGGGCACNTSGPAGGVGAFALMLGLAGLRRRRS
jgi:MYXO-CTERM domain-containing protein